MERVDIHKIIDDAMEKKDRSVLIFISSIGTSVKVEPHEQGQMSWKVVENRRTPYVCPECGRPAEQAYPHCPWCGEDLGYNADQVKEVLENQEYNADQVKEVLENQEKHKLRKNEILERYKNINEERKKKIEEALLKEAEENE